MARQAPWRDLTAARGRRRARMVAMATSWRELARAGQGEAARLGAEAQVGAQQAVQTAFLAQQAMALVLAAVVGAATTARVPAARSREALAPVAPQPSQSSNGDEGHRNEIRKLPSADTGGRSIS